MRYSQAEKMEIIRLVEASELPVKQTLAELEVPRSADNCYLLLIHQDCPLPQVIKVRTSWTSKRYFEQL